LAEDFYTGSIVNPNEDFQQICDYASKLKPDFAFIGPDDPIGGGLADALEVVGVRSVAPLKTVARLESSKGFTRELLRKYAIPGNPQFKVFTDDAGIEDFLGELGEDFVVKIVRPTIRSRIRMVFSRFDQQEITGLKRDEVERELKAELERIFYARGIFVENVLLSEVSQIPGGAVAKE
jgi:hypothetical protein